MKKNSIVIAHPAKQHSYHTAGALIEVEYLQKYITSVYYDQRSIICRLCSFVLPIKYKIKFRIKYSEPLDKSKKVHLSNFILGFLYLIGMNLDKKRVIIPRLYLFFCKRFGHNVARNYINKDTEILIAYDITATTVFEDLNYKNSPVLKLLDLTSIPAKNIHEILKRELDFHRKNNDSFQNNYLLKLKDYSEKMCKVYQKEIELADYILVPSTHVRDILLKDGVNDNRIYKVPYGMDINKFHYFDRATKDSHQRINFIFVGRVEGPKGVFYMLEAFKQLNEIRDDWSLTFVGDLCGNEELIHKQYDFCNTVGHVNFSEMENFYKESDVFILPSLWEGLSLSLLEAMAMGLPVIATSMTGAEDIVRDYKEGIVVKPANIQDLIEAILWFLNNKNEIVKMGKLAARKSQDYTWDKYNSTLIRTIDEIRRFHNE